MREHGFFLKLEDIQYKYERLNALINILQALFAETVDVLGISDKTVTEALYEIYLEMENNNRKLEELIKSGRGEVL